MLLLPLITVAVSLAVGQGRVVSPTLVAFSIEQDRWVEWSRSRFAANAFDNIRQRTGSPPHIRIGANSEDRTVFDPAVQFSSDVFPIRTSIVPYPEALNITVGDGFYQSVANLLPGTHVSWGVNFGRYNITTAFLQAQSIIHAFSSPEVTQAGITLDFLEIGNEADLYSHNGARNASTWNITEYINEWTTFATNISEAIGLAQRTIPRFLGGAFAESTTTNTSGFSPQAIIANGLLNSLPGSLITTISQHHYSGSFCTGTSGLLADLMDKSTIRGNLSYFASDIAAARGSGLDYILGESNSYSCHGAPSVSNTAGAALWALDYALYAASIGISRVHFHHGIGFKYNFIQPLPLNYSILDGSPLLEPLPPHVQPAYYAAIVASEAICGTNHMMQPPCSSRDVTITELASATPGFEHTAVYAFREEYVLARVLLINSWPFFQGDSVRPSTHVDLQLVLGPPSTDTTTIKHDSTMTDGTHCPTGIMTVKRLVIGYADDVEGLTWGGQTFETPDARADGRPIVSQVNVTEGVDIRATEAVLLSTVAEQGQV